MDKEAFDQLLTACKAAAKHFREDETVFSYMLTGWNESRQKIYDEHPGVAEIMALLEMCEAAIEKAESAK